METLAQLHTISIGAHTVQLLIPDSQFIKLQFAKGHLTDPYWSRIWPAAKALTEFLLLNQELVSEKRVLELGAGLGLPSLAVAPLVQKIICTDKIPQAVAMVAQSALLNKFSNFSTAVVDWSALPIDLDADVVLLSDVNYEPEAFGPLLATLQQLLLEGKTIILATPQRLMAKDFIGSLLSFVQQEQQYQVKEAKSSVWVTVFVLQRT